MTDIKRGAVGQIKSVIKPTRAKRSPTVSSGGFNQALAAGMLIHSYLVLSVLQVSLWSFQKRARRETCQIV